MSHADVPNGRRAAVRFMFERLEQLDTSTEREVRELVERSAANDGRSGIGEHTLLRLLAGEAGSFGLLARGKGRALAGFAQATRYPRRGSLPARLAGELLVDPAWRRRGLGRLLAVRLIGEARAAGVDRFDAWAHQADVAATRLASRLHMRPSRSLWRLSLRLGDLAAERRDAAAAGARLRTFVPGRDDATLNDLIGRAFGEHPEKSAWEPEDLAQRRAQPWFDSSAILIAEDEAGRAIGVHWMKLEPGRGEGEVYVLGVAPDAQRSGIGRCLLLAGLGEMQRRGIALAHLFVDADNEPALRLYRSVGFRPDRLETCYSLGLALSGRAASRTKDQEDA